MQDMLVVYPSSDVDHSPATPGHMPLLFSSTQAPALGEAAAGKLQAQRPHQDWRERGEHDIDSIELRGSHYFSITIDMVLSTVMLK